jgi:hypothetical protein
MSVSQILDRVKLFYGQNTVLFLISFGKSNLINDGNHQTTFSTSSSPIVLC